MSREAREWAWRLALPSSKKVILLCLAELASKDGHVFRSFHELAVYCGVSRITVIRALDELEKVDKVLRKEKDPEGFSGKGRNHYFLSLDGPTSITVLPLLGDRLVSPRDHGSITTRLEEVSPRDHGSITTRLEEVSPRDHSRNLDVNQNNLNEKPETTETLTPPRKASTSAKGKANKTTETRKRLEAIRGGPFPFQARENKVIKAILVEYEPDEIVECWVELAANPFWQAPGRTLHLNTVAEAMAGFRARRATPPPAAPRPDPTPEAVDPYGGAVPEIDAPPGDLWERTLAAMIADRILKANVEMVRSIARALGWSGDVLIIAVSPYHGVQFRRYERPVERALASVLGRLPEIAYVKDPAVEGGSQEGTA